jgi:hypothetical protein
MRIASRVFFSILLVLTFTGTALPWGLVTHFSVGIESADLIPGYEDIFIRANACPDIAWTQIFKARGLEYVHSEEFAECLYQVAQAYSPWFPEWPATASGWGAHLAADAVIHQPDRLTEEQPIHQLIELSIDTIVYYGDTTPAEGWEQYNVGPDCCNPLLIYLASRLYRQNHPGVALADPLRVFFALQSLRTTISAEYAYIHAKGNDDLSAWFLERMIEQGNLGGDWYLYYLESLTAVQTWFTYHPPY